MSNRILVAYASRAGSTAGVAESIGQALAEDGLTVDVRPMREISDLSPYHAVVAGSAIRGAKWLPEAMDWVETHRVALRQRPFAAFLVCITLAMKNGENYRDGVSAWLDPVRRLVNPVSVGLFAGALYPAKLPFFTEGMRMRLAVAAGVFPQGDHRNWEAISTWSDGLGAKLHMPL